MSDYNKKCLFFALTAKVGKTSLIMSLVSEEFPDEVSTEILLVAVYHCLFLIMKINKVNILDVVFLEVWIVVLLSSRFLSELKRSPSQPMSPQRGFPHTLWTTQVTPY